MLFPSGLRVSVEKSAHSLIGVPLYVICCFSPVTFNIFSAFNFCQFTYVSRCVPPWVYPSWDSLCFLDLVDYFLLHVQGAFSYYLFKYFLWSFLSLLLGIHIMQMLMHLVLSQRSQSVFISFHCLYPLLWQ